MKIELKNIKVVESLSEETFCYTATVYVDGERAFEARNHGHGGGDDFYSVAGYAGPCEHDVSLWLCNNMKRTDGLDYDLELLIAEMLAQHQARQRLDRMLRSKVVVIDKHEGADAVFTIGLRKGLKPTPEIVAKVAENRAARSASGLIVNGNEDAYQRALALV